MTLPAENWDEGPAFRLRSYQRKWIESTNALRAKGYSQLLLDAVGGSGKTTYAGALALEAWNLRGTRTLILENREQLVRQTAKRFADETGLEVAIEMAGELASPAAPLVVASVASLGRVNRLTGFAPEHFEYVFADEAHNSTANLFLRIMRYFHFGKESLGESWNAPKDGTYAPKCCVIGITATPDSHGKRNLGNFYQKFVDRYTYLQAIEDGWLVGIIEHNIPVRIDTRAMRRKVTGHGTDFSDEDQGNAIFPVIEELAEQVVKLAIKRKVMCYFPSKQCAIAMSDALNRRGLPSSYVLGECLDRDEKTEAFRNSGSGTCLCLCAMYVEGTDFPPVDTIGWFRVTESPSFYKQGIFRCSRALPGIVNDDMTAEERRAAIAASAKPWSMVISPFYISDKIDIMGVSDLFVDESIRGAMKKKPTDFSDPAKIRDYIKALEKAADKHAHKQPRTINPVSFALSLGLPAFEAATSAEAAPPNKEELDWLLEHDMDTTRIKTSGEAQRLIARLRERERVGLASPKQLGQLTLRLGWPEELATLMKKGQAGVMVARGIRYRAPKDDGLDFGG